MWTSRCVVSFSLVWLGWTWSGGIAAGKGRFLRAGRSPVCVVSVCRLIWEGAMGPLPWWWLKITMHWRRMRSVWIKERWFRSLLSTSRTCSWCTSLQTTTLQPLKDGSLAVSWLPSPNPLQIIAMEASSKCPIGFAGSTMWNYFFEENKINKNKQTQMVGKSCWFLSTVPLEQTEWWIRIVGQPWWIARVLLIFILWDFVLYFGEK